MATDLSFPTPCLPPLRSPCPVPIFVRWPGGSCAVYEYIVHTSVCVCAYARTSAYHQRSTNLAFWKPGLCKTWGAGLGLCIVQYESLKSRRYIDGAKYDRGREDGLLFQMGFWKTAPPSLWLFLPLPSGCAPLSSPDHPIYPGASIVDDLVEDVPWLEKARACIKTRCQPDYRTVPTMSWKGLKG